MIELEPADIHAPNFMPYDNWWIELSCNELFGDTDWDEGAIEVFEPELYVTPPPHGWTITGSEYYPHSNAAGLIAIYLAPPPTTQELRLEAAAIGPDATAWIDLLDEWRASLIQDVHDPQAYNWYLTDFRHLANLESAEWQELIPRVLPTNLDDRINAILRLEENVHYWIEDHFPSEDDYDEDGNYISDSDSGEAAEPQP